MDSRKNLIICSGLVPEAAESHLPGSSPAGNKFIRKMIQGFRENGMKTTALSYIALPGAREFLGAKRKNVKDDFTDIYVDGYVTKSKRILSSLISYRHMVLRSIDKGDHILFYNLGYENWLLLPALRRRGIQHTLLLADYSTPSEEGGFFHKIIAMINARLFPGFKEGIVLSNYARELFSSSAEIYVLKGGIDWADFRDFKPPTEIREPIRIMYAGTFSEITGIMQLLRVFCRLENTGIELHLCGKGHLEDEIKRISLTDQRIYYHGFVTDKELMGLMQKMHILCNPREMRFRQNRYNFPSKILEYLASGRIILSSKFPGWEQFKEDIVFYEHGEEGLLESLKAILDSKTFGELIDNTYLHNRQRATEYDWRAQTRRIMTFLKMKSEDPDSEGQQQTNTI